MSELKTQSNDKDPRAYLDTVEPERKREDAHAILDMMQEITGEAPLMYGESIIGFGTYQYTYSNGKPAEWFLVGFAPRKANIVLYIVSGFDQYDDLMSKLGKHKTGKSCLYINKLADVDMDVLRELVKLSSEHMATSNQ